MAIRITGAGVALTIGIIIVTGLLVGGLFWARQSGEQARRDEAAKIAQEQLEAESTNDVALNEGDKEAGSDSAQNEASSPSETTPGGATSGSGTTSTNAGASGSTAAELPQTGPSDILGIIGAGAVTFAGVAYATSRRHVRVRHDS